MVFHFGIFFSDQVVQNCVYQHRTISDSDSYTSLHFVYNEIEVSINQWLFDASCW